MFLEIKGIKKSFGTGDSRVNVLKIWKLKEESFVCFWDHPVPENRLF